MATIKRRTALTAALAAGVLAAASTASIDQAAPGGQGLAAPIQPGLSQPLSSQATFALTAGQIPFVGHSVASNSGVVATPNSLFAAGASTPVLPFSSGGPAGSSGGPASGGVGAASGFGSSTTNGGVLSNLLFAPTTTGAARTASVGGSGSIAPAAALDPITSLLTLLISNGADGVLPGEPGGNGGLLIGNGGNGGPGAPGGNGA